MPGLSETGEAHNPEWHRRSSTRLTGWLRSIEIELGGRPAAGKTRLLRLLTAPRVPVRAPPVLGVDEFAFREGCDYGTVLVDVKAGRVVDVLPDRTSETFAARLKDHPGAKIICRDRATAYGKAVKVAAPHALEVAEPRLHPVGAGMSSGELSGVDLARIALRAAMEQARKNCGGRTAKAKQPRPTTVVRRDGREPMDLVAAIGALLTERTWGFRGRSPCHGNEFGETATWKPSAGSDDPARRPYPRQLGRLHC
ncbi:transposase [Streptomyces sp. NPDC046197]|uniref:transposase n=1 Tax=Streptomyces sp. NPDC046197 TaxID=3154337 RepID=UPI0033C543AE